MYNEQDPLNTWIRILDTTAEVYFQLDDTLQASLPDTLNPDMYMYLEITVLFKKTV